MFKFGASLDVGASFEVNESLTFVLPFVQLRRIWLIDRLRFMNPTPALAHPPRFRARRGLNWGFLGLLYTSYYMCRYNFSIANKAISEEFGFSRAEMGYIITTALFAYACGQIVNGLLTDWMGGKKAMLIGAAGTVVMNVLFGAASFAGMLGLFITIRGVDGYLQAFGAPGMVKINTAWFR